MLDYFVDGERYDDRHANWMPAQTMWRTNHDHSLRRMQFEAALYGLKRDNKYDMQQKLYDWYGWFDYFSWRDLPRDCTQIMSLYVSEIHRIARKLDSQPARCVSILLKADQEDIVPIRVEQAGALLAIINSWDDKWYSSNMETLYNYVSTRPDFEMQGAAFRMTEVGAANFCMKMIASGLIPGYDSFFHIMESRKNESNAWTKKSNRTEHERNLLDGLVFSEDAQ